MVNEIKSVKYYSQNLRDCEEVGDRYITDFDAVATDYETCMQELGKAQERAFLLKQGYVINPVIRNKAWHDQIPAPSPRITSENLEEDPAHKDKIAKIMDSIEDSVEGANSKQFFSGLVDGLQKLIQLENGSVGSITWAEKTRSKQSLFSGFKQESKKDSNQPLYSSFIKNNE